MYLYLGGELEGGRCENKDVQCFPAGGWVVGRRREGETAGGCLMSPGREL